MTDQIPLDLQWRPAMDAEDFLVAPPNAGAVDLVDRWPDWPDAWQVVHGPPGCGKTHLLHVWRRRSSGQVVMGADFPEAAEAAALRHPGPLAVDEADLVAGDREAEQGLLHLMNRVREGGGTLLMTARRPASLWPMVLPDLASRVRAAPDVAVSDPDDQLLVAVLVKLFRDCQMVPTQELVGYILRRIDRDFASARAFVTALDQASLAVKRAPSIPMARSIFAAMNRSGLD